MAINLQTVPQVLGQNVKRINTETGLPTAAQLDNEWFIYEALKDNSQLLNEAVTTVESKTNNISANGKIRMVATTAPSGASARYSVELETNTAGVWAGTGLYLDLLVGGTSRFVVVANQFSMLNPDGSGNYDPIFEITGTKARFFVPIEIVTDDIIAGGVTGIASASGSLGSSGTVSVPITLFG